MPARSHATGALDVARYDNRFGKVIRTTDFPVGVTSATTGEPPQATTQFPPFTFVALPQQAEPVVNNGSVTCSTIFAVLANGWTTKRSTLGSIDGSFVALSCTERDPSGRIRASCWPENTAGYELPITLRLCGVDEPPSFHKMAPVVFEIAYTASRCRKLT